VRTSECLQSTPFAVRCCIRANADDEFTPGSNFKLLVGSAALAVSRSGFSVRDDALKRRASANDGVVLGQPLSARRRRRRSLSTADLRAAALAAFWTGIRHVDGAVIVDASHDDAQGFCTRLDGDDLPVRICATRERPRAGKMGWCTSTLARRHCGAPVKLRVEPPSGAFNGWRITLSPGVAHSEDTTPMWCGPLDSPQRIEIVGSLRPAGAPESDRSRAERARIPSTMRGDVFAARVRRCGNHRCRRSPRRRCTAQRSTCFGRLESGAMPQLLSEFLAAER